MNRRQLQALVEAQTRGREEQRRQNAAQDGHPAPKRQRPSHWPVGVDSALEMALVTRLEHAGLPLGEGQYRFVPGRLFRFDRAWPDHGMVAVEIQGGLWVNGAHSRGSGVERDCVKLSIAAALGWRGVPFPDSVAAGGAGLAARAPRLASLLLVPLPHVARDGVQRADLLGPLDLAELDRLPDGPARDAEFGSSFLDEHVVTLHTGDVTEISRLVIDYTTGQFSG